MMLEEIMALVELMSGEDWDRELVERMCRIARDQLTARLRTGVTAEDCGEAFPVAAAWIALGLLRGGDSLSNVESFSAGDLTIRTGGGGEQALEQQAWKLMAPYCSQQGFAFQGVKG